MPQSTNHSSDQTFNVINLLIKVSFVCAIFFEIFVPYKDLGPIAPSNYFFVLSTILILSKEGLSNILRNHKYLLLSAVFFVLGLLVLMTDFITATPLGFSFIKKPILKFTPILFTGSYIAFNLKLDSLLKFIVCFIALNCFIAILQGLDITFFWDLRRQIDPSSFYITSGRSSGLTYYFGTLSEQAIIGVGLATYLYIKHKSSYYLALIYVIFLGMLFTYSRSPIGATLIFFLLAALFLKRKYFLTLFTPLLLLTIIFTTINQFDKLSDKLVFSSNKSAPRITDKLPSYLKKHGSRMYKFDRSAQSRVYMTVIALNIIRDNFFLGIGSRYTDYSSIVKQYSIDKISNIEGLEIALNSTSHNFFLNFFVTHGILGAFVLVYIITKVINLKDLTKNNFPLLTVFQLTLLAIMLNSLFHNSGLLNNSYYIFILGLTLGLKFKSDKERSEIITQDGKAA